MQTFGILPRLEKGSSETYQNTPFYHCFPAAFIMELNTTQEENPQSQAPLTGFRKFRYQVFDIIDNEETSDWRSQLVDSIIMVLILLSLIATVAESYESVKQAYGWYFDTFEDITLVIFVAEYLLRLFTADFKFKDSSSYPAAGLNFMRSGSGVIDLLAIFPLLAQFIIPYFADFDLRLIRILKVTRMMRILKLSNFTASVIVVGDVFYEKRYELGTTLFTTFVVMLVASTLLYYIEHDHPYNVQNGKFTDIVSTMWWAVATLTTVGYGDIYPVTGWGQFAGSCIAILGLGVVALPTGIIGAAFIEKIENQKEEERLAKEALLAQIRAEEAAKEAESEEAQLKALQEQAKASGGADHTLCTSMFGREFVFCPYCGIPLEHHHHHKH